MKISQRLSGQWFHPIPASKPIKVDGCFIPEGDQFTWQFHWFFRGAHDPTRLTVVPMGHHEPRAGFTELPRAVPQGLSGRSPWNCCEALELDVVCQHMWVCIKLDYTLRHWYVGDVNRQNDDLTVDLGVFYFQTNPYPPVHLVSGIKFKPGCFLCPLDHALVSLPTLATPAC
jgi:hypothetical protein